MIRLRTVSFLCWLTLALAFSAGSGSRSVAQEPAPDTNAERADEIPPLIPTKAFAGRSAFRAFELSPDGARLAITREVDGRPEILVVDTATRKPQKRLTFGERAQLDWVRWAGNEKLLMSLSIPAFFMWQFVRSNRLHVSDLTNDDFFPLEVDEDVIWGGDLVHLAPDGSHALISVQSSLRKTPGVYRYELRPGGAAERIVKPKGGVWSWYADDEGVVRLGMGWRGRRLRVYYRPDENAKFELVGKLKANDDESRYWSVVQIVSGSSEGYVLEEGENGRTGIRRFDYETGTPLETFYEHPEWDVEEMWLKPDGTPLAALYTDDRRRIIWFDKGTEALYTEFKRALKMEEVRVISRSRDETTMLIWGGSEADPGAFYLFDREAKQLAVLANARPDLDFRQLVKPTPVRYTARDGLEIRAYLTLPNGREPRGLPLVILPHGGPYGVRDVLEYNDEVQLLANRGYAVLQPNFRGSGGYGDAFFEAGTGQIGRGMQDDLDDAMDWAVAEGIADPRKVCVVGGSYGGYAALWAVLRNPDRYACAASWAGPTDLDLMLRYDRKFFSRKDAKAWRARVEGEEDFDLHTVSPAIHAARLNRPVLLAHGTGDQTVPFKQYEVFLQAAKTAPVPPTTLALEGDGHSFSSSESEQQWYDALDAFLAKHNPADQMDANGALRGIKPQADNDNPGAGEVPDHASGE
ncbi:MAG: alpha/beta fold hydrolase [Erythrobacter sp.]|uniref:alpha/beta hydrolase family protein n=1 Tax=Erythrobacter sp. TaxID=1042 RepID=UPI002634C3FE|nr:alpha/beta fold hydrolase [Erythrobacter sp.]MDJ0978113.1 alpha/beta fold hydrolase [Erythrobacter sp.]